MAQTKRMTHFECFELCKGFFIIAVHTLFQLFFIRAIGLIVAVPCHCLSLTLHNLILFCFGQVRLKAKLRRGIMLH